MKYKKHVGALFVLSFMGGSPDAALVHRYRLDETFQHEAIADSAGGLDGASTVLLRGRAGMIAGALDFDKGSANET